MNIAFSQRRQKGEEENNDGLGMEKKGYTRDTEDIRRIKVRRGNRGGGDKNTRLEEEGEEELQQDTESEYRG